jgi:CubicO group peptidase (beta-lactamase class C family)
MLTPSSNRTTARLLVAVCTVCGFFSGPQRALATPASAAAPDPGAVIAELRRTLDGPLRTEGARLPGIDERMQAASVMGISVAVFKDGRLHWAQGFGEARAGVPVTAQTRFQAASVSKPVAALAALALARERGLRIDDDLRPQLKSWQPPADEPGSAPRYTLRRLLSHTAGLSQSGFSGYQVGAALPTTAQVLDGLAPSISRAVRPLQAAGKSVVYSGGGTTVVQQWVEDNSAASFATTLEQRVLQPLGMSSSHFGAPSDAQDLRYAVSHQGRRPESGQWQVYPQLAAAGLWSTPTDLAKMLMGVQAALQTPSEGTDATRRTPVQSQVAREATTVVLDDVAAGFFLYGKVGPNRRFGHNGSNQGFVAKARSYMQRGDGYVLMSNSQEGWGLFDDIERTLARMYGWQELQGAVASRDQDLPPEAAALAGSYPRAVPAAPNAEPSTLRIRWHKQRLWIDSGPGSWQLLFRTTDGHFALADGTWPVELTPSGLKWPGSGTAVRQSTDTASAMPEVLLRGSFNAWSTSQVLEPIGNNEFKTAVNLPAGQHEFKLGSSDWSQVNLGARQTLGAAPADIELQWRGPNIRLELPEASTIEFTLYAPNSPEAPKLSTRRLR